MLNWLQNAFQTLVAFCFILFQFLKRYLGVLQKRKYFSTQKQFVIGLAEEEENMRRFKARVEKLSLKTVEIRLISNLAILCAL